MSGTLFVVATPIGNLEDISIRALRILREADGIAAEDTRRTAKLLAHYAISTPTISFHQHNARSRLPQLLARLGRGEGIALVTDAGTPCVSDPVAGIEDHEGLASPRQVVSGREPGLTAADDHGLELLCCHLPLLWIDRSTVGPREHQRIARIHQSAGCGRGHS